MDDFKTRLAELAHRIDRAGHTVMLTGAGISTDSGLADFRGPDGIWTRRDKGLPTENISFDSATPNEGHKAVADLRRLGKLSFLISQNIDNLHLASGIEPEMLAELHGNITKLRCRKCDFLMDNFDDLTQCPLCGGEIGSSVVDFGRPLPAREITLAYEHADQSDLFIVAGSSLVVTPAADLPRFAVDTGAELVIINRGDTPLDHLAGLRFEEPIGTVLPLLVTYVKTSAGEE